MKKILLTLAVVCCIAGVAVAQDGKKTVKKKGVSKTLLYNPSSNNAARVQAKEARAKALDAEKAQATDRNSKPSPAADKLN